MATTSTFNLRRLIQTRLHPDDAVTDDDTSSCYEDDQRNPIKKRITTWLGPRRGSTSTAAHGRSSSDSVSPLATHHHHPHGHHYHQQIQEASELLSSRNPYPMRPARRTAPKRRTLNTVPSRSSLNEPDQDPSDTLAIQGNSDSSNTQKERRPRPQTFLASPTPSSRFDYFSPPTISVDDSSTAAEPAVMETSLENRSDPALNSQGLSRDWSEGVRQLIKETDLAFESVGNSIVDVPNSLDLPRMSQDMSRSNPDLTQLAPSPLVVDKPEGQENAGPKAEAPLDIPPRRSSRVKEDALKAERRKSRSVPPPIQVRRASSPQAAGDGRRPSPLVPAAPKSALEPPSNSHSNSHNQTPPLRPTNTAHRAQKQALPAARRPSRTTRWAIPDNVTDILTGNVFKRNEVDELLTPEQLEQLKQKREEAKRKECLPQPPRFSLEPEKDRSSLEKGHTATEPQTEERKCSHKSKPSNCSLSSHKSRPSQSGTEEVDVSGTASETSAPSDGLARRSEEKQCSASDSDEERPPTPPQKSEGRLRKQNIESNTTKNTEASDGLKTVDLLGDPSPPDASENPILPPKNPRRYDPPTKRLPELPAGGSSKSRKSSTLLKPEEDDEFFYLKSTPYSLTTPCFRHGPIAFAKSEIGKGALTMDETLDWTAFQMAILGAGEFLPDMYDEGDSKLAEDVNEWFGDFGFETHGLLIPETWPPSPRSSSHSTISSAPSENDLSLPEVDHAQYQAYDTTKFYQGRGLKQWTMEGKPPMEGSMQGPPQQRKFTFYSPPASPMMPIVVDNDDDEMSVHEEEAPMGYNLQGDLGEFLQWEAQHALGPGYYGAP